MVTSFESEKQTLPSNFLQFLNLELKSRIQNNSRYSLRAFSKSLNLSSSFLSKLLSGKRSLTESTFNKIVSRLSLDPKLTRYYRKIEFSESVVRKNKVMSLKGRTTQKLNSNETIDPEFKPLSLEQFNVIADWYHFAILELISVEGFLFNSNYIAAQLKISVFEAQQAMERLLRLGYIEVRRSKKKDNVYVSNNHTNIGKNIVTSATLKQQTLFLQKAQQALKEVPIDRRSQSSMTMAIPRERLSEARELIADFRRDLTSLLQRKGKRDSVYQLSISFYPLTKWD